jgi:hypothetical protein
LDGIFDRINKIYRIGEGRRILTGKHEIMKYMKEAKGVR